ncbi:NAD(P)/FAD-dependent oxidoreductase [Sphingopyxis panaciterrae]
MQPAFEVVVVGAGIAGAGVAADLSDSHRVLLLEQEERPGMHATGRSAALHLEIYGNPLIRALTQASRDFFEQGAGVQAFAGPRGCLHVASNEQLPALEAIAAEANVADVVEWIDARQARDLVPVLREDYVAAALSERFAYDLDVDAIHHHFLKRLRQQGGVIHSSARAMGCTYDGAQWTIVTPHATFTAKILVNAAGAWGDVVARNAGVMPIGLTPCRRSALIVDAPDGTSPAQWPAVIDIGGEFYFKPEAGKILMSPADETPSEPCDTHPEELDLAIAVDRVQKAADIPVRRIEHSWAGLRTFAIDRSPVVGFDPDHPAFFWLVGQGGYGVQTSPALSRLAGALLRGETMPADLAARHIDADDLAPARFRKSPPRQPLARVGTGLHAE